MSSQNSRQMYRIAFSFSELTELVGVLVLTELKDSPSYKRLRLAMLKVDENLATPSYVAKPRETLEEKLGLVETKTVLNTPQAKRFKAYNTYKEKGSIGENPVDNETYELALVYMDLEKIPFSDEESLKWKDMKRKMWE
jgi:hypothetical protein